MVRRDLLAALVLLAELLDERLAVRGDRNCVLHASHGVADADLDRAETWVQADVPPNVRVVGDAARALELPHDLRVVRVVAEPRWWPGARECGEDHLPARRQAGWFAAPERGARRKREQRCEMGEEAVHHLDRLLRIVDRHVHVHAEDQLATGDVLHLVDELPVAVSRGDPLALEQAERMGSGRADPHALLARDPGHVRAQLDQLALHIARGAADGRRDLEHRLHELRVDPGFELVAADGREHRVDVLDEVESLPVEELVLLLDSERVGLARAEGVVEHTAGRDGALPGDGRREGLFLAHVGRIASTSISTVQAGSINDETTVVFTGRMSEKTSP